MAKLKVFRTPIGFHDAYVAAPSQKAALKAWGSDADLFARGVAEVVTDPVLTAEPLAHPGQVVKRSRGTAAEQFAALPADRPKGKAKPAKAAGPTPRPDRSALDRAERALAEAETRQRDEEKALAAEEAALARRRQAMRAAHRRDSKRLAAKRDAADADYAAAMRAWRDE